MTNPNQQTSLAANITDFMQITEKVKYQRFANLAMWQATLGFSKARIETEQTAIVNDASINVALIARTLQDHAEQGRFVSAMLDGKIQRLGMVGLDDALDYAFQVEVDGMAVTTSFVDLELIDHPLHYTGSESAAVAIGVIRLEGSIIEQSAGLTTAPVVIAQNQSFMHRTA